jgi:hypothetical protein
MRVIIDAWNVLHVEGVLPQGLAGLDLAGLGRLMQATRWAAYHGTLVCDGAAQPRPQRLPRAIHLLWSGVSREADDVIESIIARSSTPGRLVVVSSDKRLRRAAKRRRCKWFRSEAFLRTILDDLARGTVAETLTGSEQTEDWNTLFGLDATELSAMEAETDEATMPGLEDSATPQPAPPPKPDLEPPMPPPINFPDSVLEQARRIAGGDDAPP